MVHIAAVSSGFPPYYYSQSEIVAALRRIFSSKQINFDRLEQFHHNMMVDGRHTALPIEAYETLSGFAESNRTWTKVALDLGEQVVCSLLEKSNLDPQQISFLLFTTVTGIAVPSIDARLMNRIPFGRDLKRTPLFGLGCAGGAAGVARVADYLEGHPEQAAILLSIELCSLTIQHNDNTVANLISSGLFGDGAASVLMVGSEHPLARSSQPRVIDSQPVFFPETEYIMGWDVRDTGFKMLLSADVSDIVQSHLSPAIDSFLRVHDLSTDDIAHWIVHPGGPKVMDAIEASLGLDKDALGLSRESLAEVGNVSSASVLLVLEKTLSKYQPPPGAYGLMMAMGPAFGAELVLLQW